MEQRNLLKEAIMAVQLVIQVKMQDATQVAVIFVATLKQHFIV